MFLTTQIKFPIFKWTRSNRKKVSKVILSKAEYNAYICSPVFFGKFHHSSRVQRIEKNDHERRYTNERCEADPINLGLTKEVIFNHFQSRLSLTVEQFGRVVADVAHVFGDLEGLPLVGGERAEKIDRRLIGHFAIDPTVVIPRVQDAWHAVVDGRHQLVCLGGDYGVALQPFRVAIQHVFDKRFVELRTNSSLDDKALSRLPNSGLYSVGSFLPGVSKTGNGHHFAVGKIEGEGLLVLRVELLPLVESGGGDQAASFLEGLAVRARSGDGLGAGVDGRDAFDVRELLREERDQAPAQLHQFALAGVAALADYGLHAGGSDVVVPRRQREVTDLCGVEGLGDLLFVGSSIVATAHRKQVSVSA